MGVNLRTDPRSGENGPRQRRKSRRAASAAFASVAEWTRENFRQIQAHRHRRDERSGSLRLRPVGHYFACALLRTEDHELHQDRRTHVSRERNPGRRVQGQVLPCATHPARRRRSHSPSWRGKRENVKGSGAAGSGVGKAEVRRKKEEGRRKREETNLI